MIRFLVIIFYFLLSALCLSAQTSSVSWKKLQQISILNADGNSIKIGTSQPTVFVMLSPECPLSRNYIPVINNLQKSHPEVAFYGIFPGKAYGPTEISRFRNEYHPTFSLAIDPNKTLANYFKATITPECIFVDELGIIVYRGLIDNWPSSLGQQRKVITEKYLADALSQTKLKQPVISKQTKPIGCLINDL